MSGIIVAFLIVAFVIICFLGACIWYRMNRHDPNESPYMNKKTIMEGIKKEQIAAEEKRSKVSQVSPLKDADQVTDRGETTASLSPVSESNQVVNE